MYHHNLSLAEAYPARIRIMTPQYISINLDLPDLVNSNHTLPNTTEHMVATFPSQTAPANTTYHLDVIDLEFTNHFTYYDVATFNFTVYVDPLSKRLFGSGVINSSIVLAPLCHINTFDPALPFADAFATNENWISCGAATHVPFAADAPGSYRGRT